MPKPKILLGPQYLIVSAQSLSIICLSASCALHLRSEPDEAQKKKVHDLEISFRRKSRKDLLCVLMSDERVTPERIAAFSILKKEYFGGSAEALKELLDGPVSVENIGVPIRAIDDEEWMRLVRDSQKYSDL